MNFSVAFCFLLSFLMAMPGEVLGDGCTCGVKQSERIVGGKPASTNEYPWIVSVQYSDGSGHFCGGSIIHNKWILSAAHCFQGDTSKPEDVNIVVGVNDNSDPDPESILEVKRIILHSQYSKETYDNDIALLELKNEITFGQGKTPVCLPFALTVAEVSGQTLHTIGWGKLKEGGSMTNVLQELPIPILTTAECKKYLEDGELTDNMFCAYKSGYDTCQGDSGGPTTYDKGGKHIQLGVVSWGTGCARHNTPGVYTKLQNYVKWIQEKTQASFCGQPSNAARATDSHSGAVNIIRGSL